MRSDFKYRLQFIKQAEEKGIETAKKELQVDKETANQWWRWYQEETPLPFVFYETAEGKRELKGSPGEAEAVETLPLIVEGKRKVSFRGMVFNLEGEGLYRFLLVPQKIQNLILVNDKQSPLPVLQALARLQIHGNRYNEQSLEELKKRLRNEPWVSITCGVISGLGADILSKRGFKTRHASACAVEKWNAYSNTHSLFELFFPAHGWVLVDLDLGLLFRENGRFLNAYEFYKCVQAKRKPEFYLLSEGKIDPYFSAPNGYNYAAFFGWELGTEEKKWNWYCRIFQSVGITDNESIFLGPEAKLKEYYGDTIKVLPEDQWLERFYRQSCADK